MRYSLLGELIVGALISISAPVIHAQDPKVAFRDDHTILAAGKPFFPIGLYYCGEEFDDASGKLLGALADYGFNTLGYYRSAPKWKEELDRAHQHGLKVWVRGPNGLAIESADIEKAVVEQVRQMRSHPALLLWEFQDEPILNKVPIDTARKGYQLVKKEDPNHPTLVVEWPGAADRFGLWRGIGDIFATDLYPIPRERRYGKLPNHDITQMRDYLTALRQGHGDRPFLLVLQGWAWDPLKDGERGYPSVQESRFMAYQAVIHGAKGLFYYGQYHCTKPNSAAALASNSKDPKTQQEEFARCMDLNRRFWKAHAPFFQELKEACKVFTLPPSPPAERFTVAGETAADRAIETATRTADDGVLYFLSVNASKDKHTATFRMPATLKAEHVHVLFENRKLPVRDGTFTDTLAGYDRRIYATKASLPK
jgi:hypothetical protein